LKASLVPSPVACVESGQVFLGKLIVHNSGLKSWPAGCLLACIDGAFELTHDGGSLGALPQVYPAEIVSACIWLRAPAALGRVAGAFMMLTPDNTLFGSRLTLTVDLIAAQHKVCHPTCRAL
jgi:hypothetical protein